MISLQIFVNGERYDGSWFYDPFAEYLQSVIDAH